LLAKGEKEREGKSRLVSLEMWHIANKDSLPEGKEEEGERSML
jgi:hypothetical protein